MTNRWMLLVCCALAGMAAAAPNEPVQDSQATNATARAQVLVVGDYHMANPDLDLADPQAGNVLTSKRQAQIRDVVNTLEQFRPIMIAVECRPSEQAEVASKYAKYLAGNYTLTRDEIDQIGFRVAHRLGLKTVYCVDAAGGVPFAQVEQYAKGHGQLKALSSLTSAIKRKSASVTTYIHAHTVLQALVFLNNQANVAEDTGWYYQTAHFSEPGNWAGADAVTDWYKRNIRIYSNVMHLIKTPQARVLVLFGAGHLGWLRGDFAGDTTVQLHELGEYAHQ